MNLIEKQRQEIEQTPEQFKPFLGKVQILGAEDLGVVREEKYIMGPNGRIAGILYLPDKRTEPLPLVIMSHGYNGSMNFFDTTAESLARSGIACYAFDFCGGSVRTNSDMDMAEMSIYTEKGDLEAVIAAMRSEARADQKNIYLMGESQGGVVTAITADDGPEAAKAVILYYPAFCLVDDGKRKYGDMEHVPEQIDFMGGRIGKNYYEPIMGDYDVYEHISGYRGDVLIVWGDADQLVGAPYVKKAEEIYEHAQLRVLPGEDHGFSGGGKEAACRLVYDFITERLSGQERDA